MKKSKYNQPDKFVSKKSNQKSSTFLYKNFSHSFESSFEKKYWTNQTTAENFQFSHFLFVSLEFQLSTNNQLLNNENSGKLKKIVCLFFLWISKLNWVMMMIIIKNRSKKHLVRFFLFIFLQKFCFLKILAFKFVTDVERVRFLLNFQTWESRVFDGWVFFPEMIYIHVDNKQPATSLVKKRKTQKLGHDQKIENREKYFGKCGKLLPKKTPDLFRLCFLFTSSERKTTGRKSSKADVFFWLFPKTKNKGKLKNWNEKIQFKFWLK